MGVYSREFTVPISKEKVVNIMSDPFLFSGVTTHVTILQAYDQKEGRYVELPSLSAPSNKFLVVYIFGTPDTKMNFLEGEMEGAIYTSEGVVYRGWSNDKKFVWEMKNQIKSLKPNETYVRMILSTEYKASTLDRIIGRSHVDLSRHIIEDHVVPYFKYYFKITNWIEIDDVTPLKIFEKQGVFSQILPEITKVSGNVEYGVVIIKGEDVDGEMIIKNGKIVGTTVNYKGKIIEGQEAVFELLSSPNIVNVTFYIADIDEMVISKLRKNVINKVER